jgi:hypothetical protein
MHYPLYVRIGGGQELIMEQHVMAPPDSQKNFLVVDSKTDNAAIEEAFERFTTERRDIGILLINQHVGDIIAVFGTQLTPADR